MTTDADEPRQNLSGLGANGKGGSRARSKGHSAAASLGRRGFVLGATAAVACSRGERDARGGSLDGSVSSNVRLLEWDLGSQPWGQARAAVVVPTWGAPNERFPLLIALHGRGEAVKPPADGALGWPRDYAMIRMIDRLRNAPLRDDDYEGWADPLRLAQTNASLAMRPFGGLVVACPWLPDFSPTSTGEIGAYARFLLDVLVPRVRSQTPVVTSPESTGIDGVSLGGVVALRIGLTYPDAFGAVGGIQPAIAEGQTAQWTALAEAARTRRHDLKLRLVTSSDDYFRRAVLAVSRAWGAAGIGHDLVDVPGPHDYVFNRGHGSIELLLWHDRALSRG
jgi:iron(III)-salmochelin esterase